MTYAHFFWRARSKPQRGHAFFLKSAAPARKTYVLRNDVYVSQCALNGKAAAMIPRSLLLVAIGPAGRRAFLFTKGLAL